MLPLLFLQDRNRPDPRKPYHTQGNHVEVLGRDTVILNYDTCVLKVRTSLGVSSGDGPCTSLPFSWAQE